jgi:hypothetical protein
LREIYSRPDSAWLLVVVSCKSKTNSAGGLADVLLPEPYENRVGLLAFGDAGIGIARCSASRTAKTIVNGGRRVPAACHNREIAFAHGYRQITDAVASGSGLGPALWLAEKEARFWGSSRN